MEEAIIKLMLIASTITNNYINLCFDRAVHLNYEKNVKPGYADPQTMNFYFISKDISRFLETIHVDFIENNTTILKKLSFLAPSEHADDIHLMIKALDDLGNDMKNDFMFGNMTTDAYNLTNEKGQRKLYVDFQHESRKWLDTYLTAEVDTARARSMERPKDVSNAADKMMDKIEELKQYHSEKTADSINKGLIATQDLTELRNKYALSAGINVDHPAIKGFETEQNWKTDDPYFNVDLRGVMQTKMLIKLMLAHTKNPDQYIVIDKILQGINKTVKIYLDTKKLNPALVVNFTPEDTKNAYEAFDSFFHKLGRVEIEFLSSGGIKSKDPFSIELPDLMKAVAYPVLNDYQTLSVNINKQLLPYIAITHKLFLHNNLKQMVENENNLTKGFDFDSQNLN